MRGFRFLSSINRRNCSNEQPLINLSKNLSSKEDHHYPEPSQEYLEELKISRDQYNIMIEREHRYIQEQVRKKLWDDIGDH